MHVTPSENCQACAEKLKQCHPTIGLWFEIISDNFKDCHIAIGFRDKADQDLALKDGLTLAPWGHSLHNRMDGQNPSSWAIDVFRLGVDGKAYFEKEYFQKIWDLINHIQTGAGDVEVHWGGNFTHLADYDHFEILKVEVSQKIEIISHDHC